MKQMRSSYDAKIDEMKKDAKFVYAYHFYF